MADTPHEASPAPDEIERRLAELDKRLERLMRSAAEVGAASMCVDIMEPSNRAEMHKERQAIRDALRAVLVAEGEARQESERLRQGRPVDWQPDCTDCGRPLVWDTKDRACPVWMCAHCVHQRMVTAEEGLAAATREAERLAAALRLAVEALVWVDHSPQREKTPIFDDGTCPACHAVATARQALAPRSPEGEGR